MFDMTEAAATLADPEIPLHLIGLAVLVDGDHEALYGCVSDNEGLALVHQAPDYGFCQLGGRH